MREIYRVDSERTGELMFTGAWQDSKFCWDGQLLLLRKGTHPVKRLQEHFDKFGEKDLTMTLVKKVKDEEELNKEFGKLLSKEVKIEKTKEPEKVFVVSDDKVIAEVKATTLNIKRTRKKK